MEKHPEKQRIFITGGAGFIGSNLAKYFLDRYNCKLTVYDNLSTGSRENLEKAIEDSNGRGKVEFVCADVLDFDRLICAVKDHDVVVHLAAHTQVRESIKDPKQNQQVNSVGTFNVLESARKQGIDKFVFASSNAVVGEQEPPINENMIPRPISPYGAVKLYGEALCSAYYHCYGLKTVSLRFVNVYGSYSDHKTSVIAKFLRRIKQGKVLQIYGDGMQTRDFIHAEDICRAIECSIKNDTSEPWGQVFQVGTGKETHIVDLANTIAGFANSPEKLITFVPPIKGEIRRNFSDITKARKILGFSPEIDLQTQLKGLWNEVC